MLTIKHFTFNSFAVNTYLIYNEQNESLLIDPGCYGKKEENELKDYVKQKKIHIQKQINTHCHIDHILGNFFAADTFKSPLYIHKAGLLFLETADVYANNFGFQLQNVCQPDGFIDEKSEIILGNEILNILYTPGHADGSICIVNHSNHFIITGDTLFRSAIGRTDLPTGNMNLLLKNIKEKILTLPEDYLVYPGHGEKTSIKFEKYHNPFLIN